MVTEAQVARINELAKKKKSGRTLSGEELAEQQELRQLYIKSVRENLRAQLENIKAVNDDQ